MEQRSGHDFSRTRIHADPGAARAAAALGAEAFTVGRHIAFARDRFLPGTAHGKRLLAHELTHTIQQAATSPYIALRPEKKRAAPAPRASQFDGVLLGSDRNKQEVRVKREVGGTPGYDHRLQAIAVARLANAEPSAVALGNDGKWHAFETTAELVQIATGGNLPFVQAHALPSRTGIGQSRQRVDELKATLAVIDDVEREWRTDPDFRKAREGLSPPFPKRIQAEREAALQQLNQATQTSAALTLGVPESEILQIGSLSSRVAGKINLFGNPPKGSTGGAHAPLGGDPAFEEGRASAIHIDVPEFDKPARPQKILFHEAQHKFDWDFAQEWVENYKKTGRLFVKSAQEPFKQWLNDQAKRGRLSKADVELITMQTGDASAYTEARANVREFLAALQAGAPDAATKSLVAYARGLKPKSEGGQYASPAQGSQVQAALVKELKTAYEKMPKDMKQQYDAAVTAAKKENPRAWISELDFSKRAGR
jgi:hypothetical protein